MLLVMILGVLTMTTGLNHGPSDTKNEVGSKREGKFLFPFLKVVTFDNTPCIAANGLMGTCYSKAECSELKGMESGTCANGYGVCCVAIVTCGGKITLNNTYFQNPGFPLTYSTPGMCMVEIELPKGTCQVKLDFLSFNIIGPVDGNCGNDTFTATGFNPGLTLPILCGCNAGQHAFLDADNAIGPTKLVFSLAAMPFDRIWNIKVTFLSDYDPGKAPPRCLQYYSDLSGSVSSFNYGCTTRQLLNDQGYSICYAYIPGYCDISLAFSNVDLGTLTAGVCSEDFLGIQGLAVCGTSTGTQLQANATGPIVISVISDGDNSAQQVGFQFSYMQIPC